MEEYLYFIGKLDGDSTPSATSINLPSTRVGILSSGDKLKIKEQYYTVQSDNGDSIVLFGELLPSVYPGGTPVYLVAEPLADTPTVVRYPFIGRGNATAGVARALVNHETEHLRTPLACPEKNFPVDDIHRINHSLLRMDAEFRDIELAQLLGIPYSILRKR